MRVWPTRPPNLCTTSNVPPHTEQHIVLRICAPLVSEQFTRDENHDAHNGGQNHGSGAQHQGAPRDGYCFSHLKNSKTSHIARTNDNRTAPLIISTATFMSSGSILCILHRARMTNRQTGDI